LVKLTVNGTAPFVGLPEKFATGGGGLEITVNSQRRHAACHRA